jgi:hypothetical protein
MSEKLTPIKIQPNPNNPNTKILFGNTYELKPYSNEFFSNLFKNPNIVGFLHALSVRSPLSPVTNFHPEHYDKEDERNAYMQAFAKAMQIGEAKAKHALKGIPDNQTSLEPDEQRIQAIYQALYTLSNPKKENK